MCDESDGIQFSLQNRFSIVVRVDLDFFKTSFDPSVLLLVDGYDSCSKNPFRVMEFTKLYDEFAYIQFAVELT